MFFQQTLFYFHSLLAAAVNESVISVSLIANILFNSNDSNFVISKDLEKQINYFN